MRSKLRWLALVLVCLIGCLGCASYDDTAKAGGAQSKVEIIESVCLFNGKPVPSDHARAVEFSGTSHTLKTKIERLSFGKVETSTNPAGADFVVTITGHEEEVDNVSGSGFATDLVAAISGMSVLFGTPRHEYGYTATWHLHLKRADGAVTESAGKSKQTVLCTISDDKAKLKARNKARDEALKTALLGLKADAAFRLVAGSR